MDHKQVGEFWEKNAEVWTRLVRSGHDVYRDFLNTPAFLEILPDVRGLSGIDLGCGEGHNTRQVARHGARMIGLDISETFVRQARNLENEAEPGIEFVQGSVVELPFADERFDFATAFMSLMEFPETSRALAEVHRVLKPTGFLQFSIPHPCFDTPHRRNLRNSLGRTYAIEVGNYFENLNGQVSEWIFKTVPRDLQEQISKFRVPRFTRTLSQWLNLLMESGFNIERVEEPRPSDEVVAKCPALQDAQIAAYFLHVRVRKPPG